MTHTRYLALLLALAYTMVCGRLQAQLAGPQKIDSMLKALPAMKDDTNKVKLLGDISNEYTAISPDDGIKYAVQGQVIAEKIRWKKGIALAGFTQGINYKAKGDFIKALARFQEATKIYQEIGNKYGVARVMGNMASVYRALGNTDKALQYLAQTARLFEDLHDTAGIATFTGNIGNLYCDELKNYPKALEYMNESLRLFERLGDKKGIARNAYNIGNVHGAMKDYATAGVYFRYSLKLAQELGDKQRIMDNLCGIGGVYLLSATDTVVAVAGAGGALAQINELPPAYTDGVALPRGRSALLNGAQEYLQKGLNIATEMSDAYAMMDCNRQLAQVYTAMGNYKKALEASETYHELQDTIFSQENREQVVKLDMKYEYDMRRFSDSVNAAQKERIVTLNLQKQKTYTYLGIAATLLLAGFSFFILKERRKSEAERSKSEGLLLNILPAQVAEELKANGAAEARHYDNVTVLFTDFVSFTRASERMSAQALIDELHNCFREFDEITARYNIEKIKTIGDAYLAVCGLPTPDAKHAENVVNAAREINAFMTDRLAKLGTDRTFAIRIGINSGSVVAGIVGVKKFAYDIWGDTVNTAARIEQHGVPGRINISETTYALIKDKIRCEYRGEVEAKGKGMMKMYFAE